MIGLLAAILAITLLLPPRPAKAELPSAVSGQPLPSLAPMVERVIPAVVNIATQTKIQGAENPLLADPFFRHFFNLPGRSAPSERVERSLGSGVIVDAARGIIVTNAHVIQKADRIAVTLVDGRTLQAKRIGEDQETDIAVIQVTGEGLRALPLADSDKVRVGDFVVAVGNPFGLGQTVTSGIVSAVGRTGLGIEGYEDFIQTDASINPGNSGGALVDLEGRLVGINAAILAKGGGNVGIGFAIPVNMVSRIMTQLLANGKVRRGLLGVQAQDLTPELAQAFGISWLEGAVVTRVVPGSAAEKAGLASGDVVVQINGRKIRGASDLRNRIGLAQVGDEIEVRYLRNGDERTVKAEVAEIQKRRVKGESIDPRLRGVELESGEGTGGEASGILVASVRKGSPGWKTGLRSGDRILSVNREEIHSLENLTEAVRKESQQMLIGLQRGEEGLYLLVR
ncbi:MAG: DegQ family serine endoprotease [Magnetococcales bacterium]|nr:DegQ family serine endoprotease [Magnetococcales bacterium]MBF0156901.1 DegQ family serine endoprotease [Magnetococcales bacterium]